MTQLLLSHRKVLATTVIYSEAVEAIHPHLVECGSASLARSLREDVYTFAVDALESSPDTQPLDEYVAEVAGKIIQRSSFLAKNLDQRVAATISTALREASKQVDCARCARHLSVCGGDEADDELVNGQGECMRSLHDQFAFAQAVANAHHAEIISQAPSIQLTTGHLNRSPNDWPEKCHVGGATFYADRDLQRMSRVHISVLTSQLDENSINAIPYVLFHELLVHAFQCVDSGSRRTAALGEDRFSEGWMDWLALTALDRALRDLPSTSPLFQKREDYRRVGTIMHEARCNYRLPGASKHADFRYAGRSAAEKVYAILMDMSCHPWNEFVHLSLSLNTRVASRSGPGQLVALANGLLPVTKSGNVSLSERLLSAIRTYVHNHTVQRLVDEINEIANIWKS